MKKQLPNLMGKGVYIPPTTESMVVMFTKNDICTSDPTDSRESSTEEWEEEDLSTI